MPGITAYGNTFFSHLFANLSYVYFVPGGDHLGIACLFHDWKKVEKRWALQSHLFWGAKGWTFFSPFLVSLPVYEFLQYVEFPPPLIFVRCHHINKMDFPPLHESAAPFSSTGSQAFPPPQLSIASCLTYDGFDVDKYWWYTASCLARARGWSDAILSTMFGGGESHTTSVDKQSNDVFVKLRCSRCVLSQKDTRDGPLCPITQIWLVSRLCE